MLQLHPSPIGKGKKDSGTTPYCNTGLVELEIQSRHDWIKLSFREEELPQNLRQFGLDMFVYLARKGVLISSGGWTLDDEAKGFHGFKNAVVLKLAGEVRASLQWGGKSQCGWVQLEICGGLCALLKRQQKLFLFRAACKYTVRITRVDLALDDMHGQVFDVVKIREDFKANPASFLPTHRVEAGGGNRPIHEWYESETGRTLYVGSRSATTRGVVYEKGRQLHDTVLGKKYPSWVRWETRFTRNSLVQLEPHLLHPDYVVPAALGSCDYLGKLLKKKGCRITMSTERPSEDATETAARAILTLKKQWGGVIGNLSVIFGSYELLALISRNDPKHPFRQLSSNDTEAILEKVQMLQQSDAGGAEAEALHPDETYEDIF